MFSSLSNDILTLLLNHPTPTHIANKSQYKNFKQYFIDSAPSMYTVEIVEPEKIKFPTTLLTGIEYKSMRKVIYIFPQQTILKQLNEVADTIRSIK